MSSVVSVLDFSFVIIYQNFVLTSFLFLRNHSGIWLFHLQKDSSSIIYRSGFFFWSFLLKFILVFFIDLESTFFLKITISYGFFGGIYSSTIMVLWLQDLVANQWMLLGHFCHFSCCQLCVWVFLVLGFFDSEVYTVYRAWYSHWFLYIQSPHKLFLGPTSMHCL